MKEYFRKKKVLIAGGTGGIGRAIALAFLQEGSEVFIHGRDAQKLDEVLLELRKAGDVPVAGIVKDVYDEASAGEIVMASQKFLGNLDIFVSAIGSGKYKKTGLLSKEEWDGVLTQNFISTALLISAVCPIMEKNRDSSIVVIGSIAGTERIEAPVGYAVGKAALHSFVAAISAELVEKGIRINIVHPGNIYFKNGRWEEIRNADPARTESYIHNNVPQKRFGTPEEVAGSVLFLASNSAAFISGSSLYVDGGQHTHF